MTNNIFDIQRFGKLIKRQWLNPKSYKFGSFVPAAIPILYLLIIFLNDSSESSASARADILLVMIISIIIFSPFIYFNTYNHPKKGVIDTMLPASSLEKFLVMQLTGLVYAPLFILITYGSVDTLVSFLFPSKMSGYAVVDLINNLDYNWEKSLLIFGSFQSVVFCNLWFVKNKVLKTFGVYALFGGLLMIAAIISIQLFINTSGDVDITNVSISMDGNGGSLIIRPGDHPALVMTQLFRIFMDIIMPIALTIGSYFMLKTKRY